MKRALTIAGSDSGGGAGIQADLKTFSAYQVFGTSALTAITAQNTLGVHGVEILPAPFVRQQAEVVLDDLGADAVKTGMLANAAIVRAVATLAEEGRLPRLVIDPVMYAKGGHPLLDEDARAVLRDELLPHATVVTPNLPEAGEWLGRPVRDLADMEQAARELLARGAQWAVVKGGHQAGAAEAVDVVAHNGAIDYLRRPWIDSRNTHGTGCTFSAALCAGLALGRDPLRALEDAKDFLTRAIEAGPALGGGHRPTNHLILPPPPNGAAGS